MSTTTSSVAVLERILQLNLPTIFDFVIIFKKWKVYQFNWIHAYENDLKSQVIYILFNLCLSTLFMLYTFHFVRFYVQYMLFEICQFLVIQYHRFCYFWNLQFVIWSLTNCACSSVDQSAGLRSRVSEVRVLPGVPFKFCSGKI